jgi:hypothetical protein
VVFRGYERIVMAGRGSRQQHYDIDDERIDGRTLFIADADPYFQFPN